MKYDIHPDLDKILSKIAKKDNVQFGKILKKIDEIVHSDNIDHYKNLRKPLFIRTDYYSQVLSNLDTMKNYVKESSDIIYGLENLKKNTDMEFKNYKNVLEDIQRKLIYVDKVLFSS